MPFFAKSPFSCAAQIGQLPPPPNAISSSGLGPCARLAPAVAKSAVAVAIFLSAFMLLPLNVSSDSRSEEHTSELQSQSNIVCRLLLEKKKKKKQLCRDDVKTSNKDIMTYRLSLKVP